MPAKTKPAVLVLTLCAASGGTQDVPRTWDDDEMGSFEHPFGLELSDTERDALIAFLRTL